MTATPTASLQSQRAVRNFPFEAVYVFGLDGDSGPDAAPTYSVSNAEGVVVTTGTAALQTSGPIEASFALTAAELPIRDSLTVTWSYTISAQPIAVTSTIDVCDQRLFPSSYWGQFNDKQVTSATPAQLEQARTDAENFLEKECGQAFTGRYGSEQWLLDRHGVNRFVSGIGFDAYNGPYHTRSSRNRLALRKPFVQVIRSITRAWVDPETGDSGTHTLDLDFIYLNPYTSTIEYRYNDPNDPYSGLWGELTIDYEHGRAHPDVGRICLILARYRIINGPLERRAVSMPVEGGGSISLLTPGMAASVTGIPEVDSFIDRYNQHVDGFFGGTL